uniref:Uncharacterized protein n=1 Tax=Timema genevievae TaxID=629358 RepID=A0A7R9PHM5_TIMGE|nr:unnamed protein product [Timema genevievae]
MFDNGDTEPQHPFKPVDIPHANVDKQVLVQELKNLYELVATIPATHHQCSSSSHLKMLKNTVSNQSTSKEDIIIPKRIHRGPTDILRMKEVVEEKTKALKRKEQINKRVVLKPGGIGCKNGQKCWNEMWK